MKKFSIILIAFSIISSSVFLSCKKYEDGPAFSLLSKKTRLSGEWTIESFTINDVDQMAAFNAVYGANHMFELEKDGVYKIVGTYSDTGKWELGDDKDDVYLTSDTPGIDKESLRILRLKNKEFWFKQTMSNGDVWKYKYKQ